MDAVERIHNAVKLIERLAGRNNNLPTELVDELTLDLVNLPEEPRARLEALADLVSPPDGAQANTALRAIRSDDELDAALAEVERLMDLAPARGTSDFDRLETLSILVEHYERDGYVEGDDPPAGHDDGTCFDVMLTELTHPHNYLGHPQRVLDLYNEIGRLWEEPRRAEIHDLADMPRCGTVHVVNDPETGNGVVTLLLRFPLDLDRLK